MITEAKKLYNKAYRERHKEKLKAYRKKYYSKEENEVRYLKYKQQRRAYVEKLKASGITDTKEYKEARRFIKIKNRYGITKEEYLCMLSAQKNKCALCKKAFKNELPVVDHCHVSNIIRGLVHRKCNTILGMAGDDIPLLRKAEKYLISHIPSLLFNCK